MFFQSAAMFEHDVQTSRHWAMDGELAAMADIEKKKIKNI